MDSNLILGIVIFAVALGLIVYGIIGVVRYMRVEVSKEELEEPPEVQKKGEIRYRRLRTEW
jgi:hypothetical protein